MHEPDTTDHDSVPVPEPPDAAREYVWPYVAPVVVTVRVDCDALSAAMSVLAVAEAYVPSEAFVAVTVQVPVLTDMVTSPEEALTVQIPGVPVANDTVPVPLPPVVPNVMVDWYAKVAGAPLTARPVWFVNHCAYTVKFPV